VKNGRFSNDHSAQSTWVRRLPYALGMWYKLRWLYAPFGEEICNILTPKVP
jgi:hypothetical protein